MQTYGKRSNSTSEGKRVKRHICKQKRAYRQVRERKRKKIEQNQPYGHKQGHSSHVFESIGPRHKQRPTPFPGKSLNMKSSKRRQQEQQDAHNVSTASTPTLQLKQIKQAEQAKLLHIQNENVNSTNESVSDDDIIEDTDNQMQRDKLIAPYSFMFLQEGDMLFSRRGKRKRRTKKPVLHHESSS